MLNKKNVRQQEFKLQMGEMTTENGKIKPNADKGELRIYFNSRDQVLCLQWINIDKNIEREPLIIFPLEWELKRVDTTKGRVWVLQNTTFEDDKFFFWLQYPNKAEDEANLIIINNILKTGNLVIDETKEGEEDNVTGVEGIIKSEANPQVNDKTKTQSNVSNSASNSNSDFIKNFANAFQNIGSKPKYPELGRILTKSNIMRVVDDNNIHDLMKLLPDNQQTKEKFIENISSPQFQQALESLSSALNSENLTYILQSFGLDMRNIKTINGVEAFIKCINEKHKKR